MKRIVCGMTAVLCLLVQALPAEASPASCPIGMPMVNVEEGESLWKYKQDQWQTLVALNPQLGDSWRQFRAPNGGPGVKLVIGEPICGVTRDDTGAIVPFEYIAPASPQHMVSLIEEHPIVASASGLLAALVLAFLALCAWVAVQRRKDAVTSGYPVVAGGVHGFEAASARFNVQAASSYPGRTFQILDIIEGTATGDMMVSYGDGQQPQPRRMNGERIYRARVRFTDAHGGEEDLYMLEACGNDLRRHGGLLRYVPSQHFVFTPDTVRRQEPAPAPAAAEATPAPEPLPVPVAANEGDPTLPEVPVTSSDQLFAGCYDSSGRLQSMTFDRHVVDVILERDGRTTINFLGVPAAVESAPAEASAEERRA